MLIFSLLLNMQSHPTWVRGLKLSKESEQHPVDEVAPYVGAWIETFYDDIQHVKCQSHPTWVRGLKLQSCLSLHDGCMSHPTWVRGLKLSLGYHLV